MTQLITPHGGQLVDLMADAARAAELKAEGREMPSWDLTPRQQADLGLLMNGAFSPLRGFLGPSDYAGVLEHLRLQDGTLWPIPITLDITEALAETLAPGGQLALRDAEGVMLAVLHVEHIWRPNLQDEAEAVFGTTDRNHPGVAHLLGSTHPVYVGGRVEGVEPYAYHSFKGWRYSPAELRQEFKKLSWRNVLAFHTRTPIHRAHQKMSMRAARQLDANLLIHPVVVEGEDENYYTRVRCYRAVLNHYPDQTTYLSLLPLSMRMAGPREVLWHAIVRQNYGCSYMLVGAGYADPGNAVEGLNYYDAGELGAYLERYQGELGVRMVPFEPHVYVEDCADYLPVSEIREGAQVKDLPGVELYRRLREGLDIPDWFSFPEVVAELRRTYPPRSQQGFTLFFTGLSGAGKSTVAQAMLAKLLELGGRPVTLLDGDVVRKNLSSELGFSREHRDLNVQRIGFVASEITKNRGIAICAPIAPYASVRKQVRSTVSRYGGFIEVHVATPLEVCEGRDRKGLYAKARAGLIKGFTGIDDPYEVPENPEIRLDTTALSIEEAAQQVFLYLEKEGYIQ